MNHEISKHSIKYFIAKQTNRQPPLINRNKTFDNSKLTNNN